jgi:hypothetical protein
MTLKTEAREYYAPTYEARIFIAGSVPEIVSVLQKIAAGKGSCWSVEPTTFVYTGGREEGAVVRAINYPRFPAKPSEILNDTLKVAKAVLAETGQGSCSVVATDQTVWLTRRRDE